MKKLALLFYFLLKVYSFDFKGKYPFSHRNSQHESVDTIECLPKVYDWSQTKLPNWERLRQDDEIIPMENEKMAVFIWRAMNFDSSYFCHFWVNLVFNMMGI